MFAPDSPTSTPDYLLYGHTQGKPGAKEKKMSFENFGIFMSHVGNVCPSSVTMAMMLGCSVVCDDKAEENPMGCVCPGHSEKLCHPVCYIPGHF